MAHALFGYPGGCGHIHGHSYELQVTVTASKKNSASGDDKYIDRPGFIMDFKDLKRVVQTQVISRLDHRLVLSEPFLSDQPEYCQAKNLLVFEAEPTAENLLVFISRQLIPHINANLLLYSLKLYETKDSFAFWQNEATRHSFHS